MNGIFRFGNMIHAGSLAAVVVIAVFITSCTGDHDTVQAPVTSVNATVVRIDLVPIPETYITTGTLVANERVDIAARVIGQIQNLTVREGDSVTKGQRLLTVDPVEIQNRLNEALARLAEARAQAEEAKADLERHEKLVKQKAVSERAVEQVRLRYDVTQETVRAAEAAVKQVRTQLEYTDIRSPVSGSVVAKHKRSGDMATPGAAILTIEDPTNIEVETFIKESYVNEVKVGDSVQVTIDALHRQLPGTVTQVVQSGDPGTYRYLVKVALGDTNGLRAGMFARVDFVVGEKSGIAIPADAIVMRADIPGVYLVDDNGIAHFRMVRTGRQWLKQIEIVAGLTAGDHIVVSKPTAVHTGDRVTSVSGTENSANTND